MKRRLMLWALFIFTVLTDQVSKIYIDQTFNLFDAKRIIPQILTIRYIRNAGVAFGLRIGHPVVMLLLTVCVIGILLYLFFKDGFLAEHFAGRIAMVLVLGGAVGNFIDRARLGSVIDFIQMGIGGHTWPVYNLADVYVSIGMVILFYLYLFSSDTSSKNLTDTE